MPQFHSMQISTIDRITPEAVVLSIKVPSDLKTLYEYDAINITLGLPFTRISPDHGPNEKMLGMNKSNPASLLKAIQFLDKN